MLLYLASGNRHKYHEFDSILRPLGFDIQLPENLPDVEEDGITFAANAQKKARVLCERLRSPTVADDSGLVVPALGGAPGIYSARFAQDMPLWQTNPDAANRQKLLHMLQHVDDDGLQASMICVIAYCPLPDAPVHVFHGALEGRIVRQASGLHGFGYDTIFTPDGMHTMGDLLPAQKNSISHRSVALQAFAKFLKAQGNHRR